MKQKDIEKRLKEDVQNVTPSNFDKIWEKCEKSDSVFSREFETEKELVLGGANGGNERKKGITVTFTAIALAFVLVVMTTIGALAGWFKGNAFDSGSLILDINPSIQVSYNEKGITTEVVGLNEDGRVLLKGLQLEGKAYEDVAETIFSRCVALGYFSVERENNAVLISALKDNGKEDERMTKRVCDLFSTKFIDTKMRGVALTGVFDDTLKDEAKECGVNVQKYALIQEYEALVALLEKDGEISEEQYQTVSIRDLYEEIEELEKELQEKEIGNLQASSFSKAVEKITEIIENMEDNFEDKTHLENIKENIEHADSPEICRFYVDELMRQLGSMNGHGHPGPLHGVIDEAYREIDEILRSLDKLQEKENLTEEEHFQYREENFGNKEDKPNMDKGEAERWQEENEDRFYNDWFHLKNQWKKDRWYD